MSTEIETVVAFLGFSWFSRKISGGGVLSFLLLLSSVFLLYQYDK